ncbi:MAG: hypothetical protein U9R55_03075 [Pseudomonadota bacterium]|nr:hypothetical protein [Pseudomonadota bacterium]
MVAAVHLLLAIGLFLTINWIGRHSHSLGYISLGLFVRRDEAPAFNLALRLLGPVVFITIVAAIFYAVGLDSYVQDIWQVTLYYFAGRATFNVLMGRSLLINWLREVVIGASCIWISWLIYESIIKHKKTLLPDFTTATNELWVFVGLFVYTVLNQVDTGTRGSEMRKNKYLKTRFSELSKQYGKVIDELLPDELSRSLGMTILIYESFNRPWLAQKLERLVFPVWGKSLGPMQVTTAKRIDDIESVRSGAELIATSYRKILEEVQLKQGDAYDAHWRRWYLVRKVAADYNKDDRYVDDVRDLHDIVVGLFYPQLKTVTV